MAEYPCSHCNDRSSPFLWLCPEHAVIGTCDECGTERQYLEVATRLCRWCFWCEWPIDKPEPGRDLPGTDQPMEVTK